MIILIASHFVLQLNVVAFMLLTQGDNVNFFYLSFYF
jgi:hypothetical protein